MLKRIVKTSFFSLGARGFLTLSNLLIMYSIANSMGESQMGIYSISAFFYYLFSFLTSFELTTYFGKEVALVREKVAELNRLLGEIAVTFLIGIAGSVVLGVVVLLFYDLIGNQLLLISMLSGVIFGFEKNLSGVLLGKEKMQFEFVAQVAAFCIVAVPVLFFVDKLGLTGIYVLRIVASLLTIVLRNVFVHMGEILMRKNISLTQYNWKEIKHFAASGLAYFVQHHLDLFILSFLISKELQGAYFLALRIYLSFCLLAEMTSFALTPYISRVYRNKEQKDGGGDFKKFYKRILFYGALLGALASVALFLGRHLITPLFSNVDPVQSAGFLYYFSFFLFFRFASYYTGIILTATGFQNIRFYILVSSAVLMILLEVILGNLFSIEGIIISRALVELFIFSTYLIAVTRRASRPV